MKLVPLTYRKMKFDENTLTEVSCHAVLWLPLRLHAVFPAASTTLSVPIVAPYMLYAKDTSMMGRRGGAYQQLASGNVAQYAGGEYGANGQYEPS